MSLRRPALLDINVLIALLDANHVFHEKAQVWWLAQRAFGWASCALTQNGFVRIASQLNAKDPAQLGLAMQVLARLTQDSAHQFWQESISLLDATRFERSKITGHRQITDAYLLGLAVKHGASFATFDQNIPLACVPRVPRPRSSHSSRTLSAAARSPVR